MRRLFFLAKVLQAKLLRDRHNGEARRYVLSLLTFYRRVKKVSRLPAGTGGVEVEVFKKPNEQNQDRGMTPRPLRSLTW
jgi:hypothetical protein